MDINILFTSAGRRNVLIRYFYTVLKNLGKNGSIFVGDVNTKLSSVANDSKYIPVSTPSYNSINFIPFLLSFCKEHKINIIIPLMDGDLYLLSQHKKEFESIGTRIIISSPETILICNDKRNTHKFFEQYNIISPKVLNTNEINKFPVFLKPYDGIGSRGAVKLSDMEDFNYWSKRIKNPLFLELLEGDEYTVDVYVSLIDHKPKIAIPRKRIEVRAGEVNKSLIDRKQFIIDASLDLVKKLPESEGVLTIQCFIKNNVVSFFEINPRFGGGAPHSISAGANFPLWIIKELIGLQNKYICKDNVLMLRYEDAVFVNG